MVERLLPRLEAAGVARYKIASRSIRDTALLDALARTGKPLIISLGFWEHPEFPVVATQAPVEFLHCVAKYPAPLREIGLSRIDFGRYGGFSDHSLGMTVAMAALARGARILEKHLTLDKTMEGPDHAGSMDPDELTALCRYRDELMQCF